MSDKEYVKSLEKEAELYRTQGLLEQSKEKYLEIFKFAKNHEHYSKDNKFINSLKKRIGSIEDELTESEEVMDTPELSPEMQNLIQKLFTFSQNEDMAKIEGAEALVKFGQYGKALEELERLVKERTLPLEAATNMLRCHLAFSSLATTIDQLKQWESERTFFSDELNYLRSFLKNILQKDGIKEELSNSPKAPPAKDETTGEEDVIFDILSIALSLSKGPRKGQTAEFDVSFQSDNKISVIIPSTQKDLAGAFESGDRFTEINCYSHWVFFKTDGVVTGKTMIQSGPKGGNYALDITLE